MPDFKLTESGQKIIENRLENIRKEMHSVEDSISETESVLYSFREERESLLCEEAVLAEALRKFK